MTSTSLPDTLRMIEQKCLGPFLQEMGAEPICGNDFILTLLPGTVAFLMNDAESYTEVEGVVAWSPLKVVYCDDQDRNGVVFHVESRYDPAREVAWFQTAEITNVVRLERIEQGKVRWIDPLQNLAMLTLEDAADKLMRNAWYLFRGAVLPLCYQQTYRFHEHRTERIVMQANLIHQIRVLYEKMEQLDEA